MASLHHLIQQKRIPERGSASLNRFSEEEQSFLIERILPHVHLTTNQLIRLTEWLSDLKKLKNLPLQSLFQDSSILEIISNPRLNLRTRGEKLFERVRSLRFPNVTRFLKSRRPSPETLL